MDSDEEFFEPQEVDLSTTYSIRGLKLESGLLLNTCGHMVNGNWLFLEMDMRPLRELINDPDGVPNRTRIVLSQDQAIHLMGLLGHAVMVNLTMPEMVREPGRDEL